MRRRESNGPREDDWLAEEDWLEAPTEEMSSPPRQRPRVQPPPGMPSRRLLALVAGISVLLLAILVIVFQGDGDEPEETAATTTQTGTATAPGGGAAPSLQLQQGDELSEGDSGPRVRRLQRALAELGYDVAPDGVFGPGTTAAVRAFQEEAGVAADGVVGASTVRALNAALAERG